MARHARPWFRPSRGVWYVTFAGKQYNLGTGTEEDAEERFVDLKREFRRQPPAAKPAFNSVVAIIDDFLEWVKKNRVPRTFDWYLDRLQPFAKAIQKLSIDELCGYHLQSYVDGLDCSPAHRPGIMTACPRPFRAGYQLRPNSCSSFGGREKPAPRRR